MVFYLGTVKEFTSRDNVDGSKIGYRSIATKTANYPPKGTQASQYALPWIIWWPRAWRTRPLGAALCLLMGICPRSAVLVLPSLRPSCLASAVLSSLLFSCHVVWASWTHSPCISAQAEDFQRRSVHCKLHELPVLATATITELFLSPTKRSGTLRTDWPTKQRWGQRKGLCPSL